MPNLLLGACEQARSEGQDFPTIWHTILRRHSLVKGLPTHLIRDGQTNIVVPLTTGQKLLFGHSSFSLHWL